MLGALGLGSGSAMACVEMNLCLDGIEGESTSDVHTNCIDVLAWSWGMSNSGSVDTGGGTGSGKVNVQDLSVTKYIDKSTPDLMLRVANGKHIAKAELFTDRCGQDGPAEYFELVMENVLVTSVSTGGSGGEDRLTENISLNFSKVQWCYTEATDKAAKECYGWDIAANTQL